MERNNVIDRYDTLVETQPRTLRVPLYFRTQIVPNVIQYLTINFHNGTGSPQVAHKCFRSEIYIRDNKRVLPEQ